MNARGFIEKALSETEYNTFRFVQRFQEEEWETRGCVRMSEARKGVRNIMTMKLRQKRESAAKHRGNESYAFCILRSRDP